MIFLRMFLGKKVGIIIMSMLICTLSLNAQQAGNHVYEFLNSTNSSRVAALGSNFLSTNDGDISLTYSNPSLINASMHNNISLDYVDYISDINSGLISYGYNFKKIGTFVANFQFASYGEFDLTDISGQTTGTFRASDYALIIGWAKPLSDNLTIGANIKNIFSSLESYNSYGIAADVALTYFNKKDFSASLIFANMGRQIVSYTDGDRESLPFNMKLGIAKKFEHAPFRIVLMLDNLHKWDLAYNDPNSNDDIDPFTGEQKDESAFIDFADNAMRHVAMGVEFVPGKGNFMVRLGYNYRRQREMKIYNRTALVGFSFGFGIKVKKFKISYTRSVYHLAGGTNTISIGTNFSSLFANSDKSSEPAEN